MHLSHPKHPIWAIIKICVICFFAALAMYIYATEFDATEVKSLATFAAMMGGAEGIRHGVRHFTSLGKNAQEKDQ